MSLWIFQFGLCKYSLLWYLPPYLIRPGYLYLQFFIAVSSGSYSSMSFVDRIFFSLDIYIYIFDVVTLLGRYLVTSFTVSPGHDCKFPVLITLIHVDLNGFNAAVWRHFTKFVLFVVWYVMFILCYISLYSCGFLFFNETLHNLVYLSLVTVKIIFPLLWCGYLCVLKLFCTLHQKISSVCSWTVCQYW